MSSFKYTQATGAVILTAFLVIISIGAKFLIEYNRNLTKNEQPVTTIIDSPQIVNVSAGEFEKISTPTPIPSKDTISAKSKKVTPKVIESPKPQPKIDTIKADTSLKYEK